MPISNLVPNNIREIAREDDPLWPAWKEIYLAGFPPNERMSIGFFEKMLAKKSVGEARDQYMLALSQGEGPEGVTSIAYYDWDADSGIAFLWYLATHPDLRSRGYGVQLYAYILERIREAGAKVLVFEVEIPELAGAKSPQEEEWAKRRIGWYERQGACLIHGIQYFQGVDATDELTEMHLMVHLLEAMSAEQVYNLS